MKLQSPFGLDGDDFVAEVKKVRGKRKPLTAAALKALRDEYARSVEPARNWPTRPEDWSTNSPIWSMPLTV